MFLAVLHNIAPLIFYTKIIETWYKSCIISIIKDITLITEIIYFERRNNQMANRMILNETSYFGAGSISKIVTEAKKRAFKKALVVTDPDLIKFNVAKNVTRSFGGSRTCL